MTVAGTWIIQIKPAACITGNDVFHVIGIVCIGSCRCFELTLFPFTSRIIESADLVGLLIDYDGSARRVFTDSHIKSAGYFVKDFPVPVRDVGADDILREGIGRNDAFFIKRIKEGFQVPFVFIVFFNAK